MVMDQVLEEKLDKNKVENIGEKKRDTPFQMDDENEVTGVKMDLDQNSMARNENNLLSVPYINEEDVEHDYLSTLPLGFLFCPTASEIIVYFLMPKIKTGTNHPKWHLYEDFGYWKTTQKDTTVYMCDDRSGPEVGKKRCFVYYDASNKKSQWLMHEYTTIDPNIPVGSREDKMKLSDWVLAKIYKKDENQNDNNNGAYHVENMMNSEELMEDQKQLQDEPSARQRRISMNKESNQKMELDTSKYKMAIITMELIYQWWHLCGLYSFHQAYSSYQDFEHPQATLQSFPDEPMEWTEDDISKEIVEFLTKKYEPPIINGQCAIQNNPMLCLPKPIRVVVLTAERDGGSWQPKVAVIVGEEGKGIIVF
nr:hypothetical protein [Tanacetum cinerariifolium]